MEPRPTEIDPEWELLDELNFSSTEDPETKPKKVWGRKLALILTILIFTATLILPNLRVFKSRNQAFSVSSIYTKLRSSIPITADSKLIISPSEDTFLLRQALGETIPIFALPNSNRIANINLITDDVIKVAYSYDGQHIAIASTNGDLSLFNAYTGNQELSHPSDAKIKDIAWSPNALRLATLYSDNTLLLWNLDDNSFSVIENNASGFLSWSHGGKYLAISEDSIQQGMARVGQLYDMDKQSPLSLPNIRLEIANLAIFLNHSEHILYSSDQRDKIYQWDFSSATPIEIPVDPDDYWINGLSPDENLLYILHSGSMSFSIWDLSKQALQSTITVEGDSLYTFSWMPDSSQLAFAYTDRVDFYNANTGKFSRSVSFQGEREHDYYFFTPDSRFVLSHDGLNLFFWDSKNGSLSYKLPAISSGIGIHWLLNGSLLLLHKSDAIGVFEISHSSDDPNLIQSWVLPHSKHHVFSKKDWVEQFS